MKKKKRFHFKYWFLCMLLAVLLFLAAGFYNELKTTHYTFTSSKLPAGFDGYKIVLISDLHCAMFGNQQEELIAAIKSQKPDMIAFTGDMMDANQNSLTGIEPLLKGIQGIAPIYSVSGNHEIAVPNLYNELLALYASYGIIDADNQTITLHRNGDSIQIYGLPWFWHIEEILPMADNSMFSILLFHGTNLFDTVSKYNYDLVLSGHTHGGVVRLPFIGGILGNSGEIFPKYDAGMFHSNNSTLISSCGLGQNSTVPRFFNRPEVVTITLNQTN